MKTHDRRPPEEDDDLNTSLDLARILAGLVIGVLVGALGTFALLRGCAS